MATFLFPDTNQILNFFHVSEYLRNVARQVFEDGNDQKQWFDTQQEELQCPSVIKARQRLPPGSTALGELVEHLIRYFTTFRSPGPLFSAIEWQNRSILAKLPTVHALSLSMNN